jgi:hypothetical protein
MQSVRRNKVLIAGREPSWTLLKIEMSFAIGVLSDLIGL